jgi:Ni/Co efflux regulator RcnB
MRQTLAIVLLAVSMTAVQAQGAASAPGMGAMGGMRGMQMNRDNTPGWSMMNRAERREHHDKMMAMTDPSACMAYMDQHHAKMAERAKERGRTLPAKPRRDACAPLKK